MKKTLLTLASFAALSGLIAQPLVSLPFTGNTVNNGSKSELVCTNNGATLVTDRFCVENSAYHFDGSTQYMEIPSSPILSLSTWSFAVWIKPESMIGQTNIIGKSPDSNGDYNYEMLYDNGKVLLEYEEKNNETDYMVSAPVALNEWSYVVATRDAAGKMTIYVNGVAIETKIFTQQPSNSDVALRIGNLPVNKCYFKGCIDDIEIYNYALSELEIQKKQGLLVYLPFNGSLINYGSIGGEFSGNTKFTADGALEFDGNALLSGAKSGNEYLDLPKLAIRTWTISAHVKPVDNSPIPTGIVGQNVNENGDYSYELIYENGYAIIEYEEAGNETDYLVKAPIPVGKWSSIVATRDDCTGTLSIYVDGKLIEQAIFTPKPVLNAKYICVGSLLNEKTNVLRAQFNGDIDDVRIYNTVVPPAAVEQKFDSLIAASIVKETVLENKEIGTINNDSFVIFENNALTKLSTNKPIVSFELYSISGVLLQRTNEQDLYIENLNPGIYIAKAIDKEGHSATIKVVK